MTRQPARDVDGLSVCLLMVSNLHFDWFALSAALSLHLLIGACLETLCFTIPVNGRLRFSMLHEMGLTEAGSNVRPWSTSKLVVI